MFDREKLKEVVAAKRDNPKVEAARGAYMRFHMETENPNGQPPSQSERVQMLDDLNQAIDEISIDDIKAGYDRMGLKMYQELEQWKTKREAELQHVAERERDDDRDR